MYLISEDYINGRTGALLEEAQNCMTALRTCTNPLEMSRITRKVNGAAARLDELAMLVRSAKTPK